MQNTSNGMSTAALVLSIIGILTMCCGGSVVLGGLAILLALLSRGSHPMNGQAKAAVWISIIGIILGIVALVGLLVYTFTSPDAQDIYRDYLQYYEDQLGDDDDMTQYYNDYLDDYGIDDYNTDDNGTEDFLDYLVPDDGFDHAPYQHKAAPGITNL